MRILTLRMNEMGGRGWGFSGVVRSDMFVEGAEGMEEQVMSRGREDD